ncbi:hypothetical protein [Marinobacterium jannaschii]|uniref:hypothetical protein n=1 Tax=Marinobacterium jannaschii TaxID=64970 RepID=UPI0004844F1C|nr:hypothetical protein [Marinobacterium jannaschii]
MTDEISPGRFLKITPAGAYYATVGSEPDDARALLLQLLSADISLPYSPELIEELTDLDAQEAKELFDKLLTKGFVELADQPGVIVSEAIEKMLPELLPALSDVGRVVFADDQGFCLGVCGYDDAQAEGLAALAADLGALHDRHRALLGREIDVGGESWGLIDPLGFSQIGFWVLNIGSQKFILVIDQMPKLNQQAFVDLLSMLARRYLDY